MFLNLRLRAYLDTCWVGWSESSSCEKRMEWKRGEKDERWKNKIKKSEIKCIVFGKSVGTWLLDPSRKSRHISPVIEKLIKEEGGGIRHKGKELESNLLAFLFMWKILYMFEFNFSDQGTCFRIKCQMTLATSSDQVERHETLGQACLLHKK